MQGENILLEEIAKLKSQLRGAEKAYQDKARLWIEQTGAVDKLETELDAVKFDLIQMKRRVIVADANGNTHPSWETADHKELLSAFKFQGAMTKVLLDETDQRRERIILLKDAIRGMMSLGSDEVWEIGDIALNVDARKDVW